MKIVLQVYSNQSNLVPIVLRKAKPGHKSVLAFLSAIGLKHCEDKLCPLDIQKTICVRRRVVNRPLVKSA